MAKRDKTEESKAKHNKTVKRIRRFRERRPRFSRQESWRYTRIKDKWKKPKGIDSKMRLKRKGYHILPNIGYRLPRDIRGRHPSGLSEILVHTVQDLKGLNPETHAVRIAHTVGVRKRIGIQEEAKKLGLTLLNPLRDAKLKTGEPGAEAAEEAEKKTEEKESAPKSQEDSKE